MDDRMTVELHNAHHGVEEVRRLWRWCKGDMRETGRPKRLIAYTPQSRAQQCTYHSALEDLARDCLLGGQKSDAWTWKRSTLCAFFEATKDDPEFKSEWMAMKVAMVPDLNGRGFHLVAIQSAQFSHSLAGAYLSFLHATGDERGVNWSPQSLGRLLSEEAHA